MQCPKCGFPMSGNFQACPKCGYKASYGGNTEFYRKAAYSKLSLKDVFSDVFKHHNKTDGERMFMAGTSLTTPNEREMLSEWRKPWLFAWVGGIGFIFIGLMFALSLFGAQEYAKVPLVFMGATIIPLAVLLFFWEMNIPRNIPIYNVILMFLIGGAFSLIFTLVMNSVLGDKPAYMAPLTEEPAKLIALCIFLRKPKNKYIFNGLLIGAAIGTGFAAIETMGYSLRSDNYTYILQLRGIMSPGGHVAWAAMYGGALAMVKGSQKLQAKHFFNKNFLTFFGIACLLHFIWNSDMYLLQVPLFGDLKYVLLVAAAWIALLAVIKMGIRQVLAVSVSPVIREDNVYSSVTASILRCISGVYKDSSFPISNGTLLLGRDSKRVNIVFPPSTPGISSMHCEVRNDGERIILVDRGSSYGTFLSNGTKLVPNHPYVLHRGDTFYLANHNNQFQIM